MNSAQFKDPVSHMCLPGAVVVSWSFTQEIEGLKPFTIIVNILVTKFNENIYGFNYSESRRFIIPDLLTLKQQ